MPNAHRIPLHFSARADAHLIKRELSAVVQVGSDLFLGSDEGVSIERLSPLGDGTSFGAHVSFALSGLLDLPGVDDEEIDVEGLAAADGWLWVVGSHSVRRRKPDPDDDSDDSDDDDGARTKRRLQRLAKIARGSNRHLLARIPLVPDEGGSMSLVRTAADGDGAATRTASRLPGGRRANTLRRTLRDDAHFAPFLDIPDKDNGFNVEGLAAAGERLFVGLRGPVLGGWGAVLCVEPRDGRTPDALALRRIGPKGRRYTKHFLDLRGLGVRELFAHDDDLYVLAAPTMTLDGRATVLRWRGACRVAGDSIVDRDHLEHVFDLPYGRGDAEHLEHPEGMALVTLGGRRGLLIVYDAPADERERGEGGVEADFFAL